jgi:hypothetical protein
MMGHREPIKSGDEFDAISRRWRRLLCLFQKPGIAHATKRKLARRARKSARAQIRAEREAL